MSALELKRLKLRNELSFELSDAAHGGPDHKARIKELREQIAELSALIEKEKCGID